ncbi:ferritin-like domain-containing protein [Pseudomonas sp. WS 5096]|uniref:Ferritin-like domain-containing protein n=1 Tax=Pseudomonas cremoris TaxID=2724178 RepID=A0ABR6TH50_9PSED|nr:hypothetical protein [Pseudomonas cremoris]MBC2385291.1 ferritin-like domain-containing protein [Pseudomonas cremoris]
MFYEAVKAAWLLGDVKIGLPSFGYNDFYIKATGINFFKVALLSARERQSLIDLAQHEVEHVATLTGAVESWTQEQRDLVWESIKKFGLPIFPPSMAAVEDNTPQRRFLLWESKQMLKRQLEGVVLDPSLFNCGIRFKPSPEEQR